MTRWRPGGIINRSNALNVPRRIQASVGQSSSATEPSFSRFPIPPVYDDFTKLTQQNLARFLDEENAKSAVGPKPNSEAALANGHSSLDTKENVTGSSESDVTRSPRPKWHQGSPTSGRTDSSQSLELDKGRHSQSKFRPPRISIGTRVLSEFRPVMRIRPRVLTIADDGLNENLDHVLTESRNLLGQSKDSRKPSANQKENVQLPPLRAFQPTLSRSGRSSFRKWRWWQSAGTRKFSTFEDLSGLSTGKTPLSYEAIPQRSYITDVTARGTSGGSMQPNLKLDSENGAGTIREHLGIWQAQRADAQHNDSVICKSAIESSHFAQNLISQSGEGVGASLMPVDDDFVDDSSMPGRWKDDLMEGTIDLLQTSKYFRQGDLVEISSANGAILTIFVKNLNAHRCVFYSEYGTWIIKHRLLAQFSVPRFLDPSFLNNIIPLIPSEDQLNSMEATSQSIDLHAPRKVGRRALEKMQHFRQESEDLYRRHSDKLNHAYENLAPSTYNEAMRTLSLEEVTKSVLQVTTVAELTPAMLWTVHRVLCKMSNITTMWHSHRRSPFFDFIPRQNLDHLEIVRRWVREHQELKTESPVSSQFNVLLNQDSLTGDNPIVSFVHTARHNVALNRRKRDVSPVGGVGPDLNSARIPGQQGDRSHDVLKPYSKSDRMIIHYLDAWATARTISNHDPRNAVGPAILRATALYENLELNQAAGFNLLQELGIFSPWQNPTLYRTQAGLPGYSPFHPVTKLRDEAQQTLKNFELQDTMTEFRKDWGPLPVYCIDSADTTEHDDGISIEEIGGTGAEAWLHIHVANPTAFINPESVFARYAACLSETVYLPELKLPMLEPELCSKHFSLASGRPCLTFSARVNQEGQILESAISHGTIHNVFHVTPEIVQGVLNLNSKPGPLETPLIAIGRPKAAPPDQARDISPSRRRLELADAKNLQRLLALSAALERERGGVTKFPNAVSSTSNHAVQVEVTMNHIGPKQQTEISGQSQAFALDPTIRIMPSVDNSLEAHEMVANLMVLSGQICARWCMDRKIPIPFRGFRSNPEPGLLFPVDLQDLASSSKYLQTEADFTSYFEQLRQLGTIDWSASPLQHIVLNVQAYAKSTSPLRRYSDLLTHWQLEAAIRYEQNTKSLLHNVTETSYLPFSYEMVEAACRRLDLRDFQIRDLRIQSHRHWIVMALFRAFYFKESQLPESFQVRISQDLSRHQSSIKRGRLIDWGLTVHLKQEPQFIQDHDGYKMNDVWEAQISKIHMYNRIVEMRPTRLLYRENGK